MNRYILPIALTVILSGGSAMAQVGGQTDPGVASPLGLTSPLGLAPGSRVSPTGLPMGATELATPGVSPPPDMSMVFDGGGIATTVASQPIPSGSASAPMPMTSPQMVGRLGIPLGSVELGGGGLSPPPDPTAALIPAPTMAAPSAFAAPAASPPPAMSTAAPAFGCPVRAVPSSNC